MLKKIKVTKNLNDIKGKLPKKKNYDSDKKLIQILTEANSNSNETKANSEITQSTKKETEQILITNQKQITNQQKQIPHTKISEPIPQSQNQNQVVNNNNVNVKIVIKENMVMNRPISCGNQVKVKNVLGDNYVDNMNKVNKLLNNIGNVHINDVKSRPMSSRPQIQRTNNTKDDQVREIIKLNKMKERPRSPARSPRIMKPVLDSHDRQFIEKVQRGDFRSKAGVIPIPSAQPKPQSPYENKANMLNLLNNRANERVFSQAPRIIRMNNRK